MSCSFSFLVIALATTVLLVVAVVVGSTKVFWSLN